MKGCLWLPDCGFYCKNGFIFSRFPALYPAAVKCEFCCFHLFFCRETSEGCHIHSKTPFFYPLFTEQIEIDLNVVIC